MAGFLDASRGQCPLKQLAFACHRCSGSSGLGVLAALASGALFESCTTLRVCEAGLCQQCGLHQGALRHDLFCLHKAAATSTHTPMAPAFSF